MASKVPGSGVELDEEEELDVVELGLELELELGLELLPLEELEELELLELEDELLLELLDELELELELDELLELLLEELDEEELLLELELLEEVSDEELSDEEDALSLDSPLVEEFVESSLDDVSLESSDELVLIGVVLPSPPKVKDQD